MVRGVECGGRGKLYGERVGVWWEGCSCVGGVEGCGRGGVWWEEWRYVLRSEVCGGRGG